MDNARLYKVDVVGHDGGRVTRYAMDMDQARAIYNEAKGEGSTMFVDVWGPAETWGRPFINMGRSTFCKGGR